VVRVRHCDGRREVVRETINVRFGCTVVDARRGSVEVVTARDGDDGDVTQVARFNAGVFRVVQREGLLTEVILVDAGYRSCSARQRRERTVPAPDSTRGARRVRLLLGDGSGRFRTRGRFASAAIRGTKWGTQDFCHGTLLVIREGRISVRDLVRRRTVELTAPDSYFVRAPA
jgi:hypothetical protein